MVLGYSHFYKLWVVDNILPEHVELPHVLDLAGGGLDWFGVGFGSKGTGLGTRV